MPGFSVQINVCLFTPCVRVCLSFYVGYVDTILFVDPQSAPFLSFVVFSVCVSLSSSCLCKLCRNMILTVSPQSVSDCWWFCNKCNHPSLSHTHTVSGCLCVCAELLSTLIVFVQVRKIKVYQVDNDTSNLFISLCVYQSVSPSSPWYYLCIYVTY